MEEFKKKIEDLKGLPSLPKSSLIISDLSKRLPSQDVAKVDFKTKEYTAQRPYFATVTHGKLLTRKDAVKQAFHIELDLGESGLNKYVPGDAFGIISKNSEAEVAAIASHLGLDLNSNVNIQSISPGVPIPCHLLISSKTFADDRPDSDSPLYSITSYDMTIRELLSGLDTRTVPKKAFLRLLGDFSTDLSDKYELLFLSSRQGAEEYRKMAFGAESVSLSLLDLFRKFPSSKPPLEKLIEALPPLPPRYFSASSSPLSESKTLHLSFNLVQYDTPSGPRSGVASSFLASIISPFISQKNTDSTILLPLFKRRTGDFQYRESSHPVIMIATGTGLAPFRSFLRHRRQQLLHHHAYVERESQSEQTASLIADMNGLSLNQGVDGKTSLSNAAEWWLFFGCRHKDRDYLYGDELEKHLMRISTGGAVSTLQRLELAFSRDSIEGSQKEYVQHKLEKYGAEISDLLLHRNAIVYICGEAKGMTKGVQQTIHQILQKHGEIDQDEASKLMSQWVKDKRYLIDQW